MPGTSLSAVVFDMGNVLMTFDGPRFARIFTDTEEDARLLYTALFGRHEWSLLDAGAIGHDTMARIAEAALPERLLPNLHDCIAHWPEHSEPLGAMNDLAARLKERGLGIYLLSNASTRIHEQLERMPAWPLMDGSVVSGFERIMKPDPAIYRLLCERYGLDPARCLFVDDNADNCRGAEVTGMRSFHFTGVATGDIDGCAAALERAIDAAKRLESGCRRRAPTPRRHSSTNR